MELIDLKPFACDIENCGMSFTNEDHLNVHRKKHDMVLNFGGSTRSAIFLGKCILHRTISERKARN